MTTIEFVTLEVPNPTLANDCYTATFAGDIPIASKAPTTGFRGFTLSLKVSQSSTVNSLIESAIAAGATVLKPVAKSFWGYGGVVQAPDGTIWKIARSRPVKPALYGHRALANDAGVPPDGGGSHRIVIVGDSGSFTDLDEFEWEAA
jgi:hypothetical protein